MVSLTIKDGVRGASMAAQHRSAGGPESVFVLEGGPGLNRPVAHAFTVDLWMYKGGSVKKYVVH